jgi:methyl-accepting chemotaxis protein
MDRRGKPYKVVKFATVITDIKERQADYEGQITAINKAMAVITFSLDGHILHANDMFLSVAGYELREVVGQHHSMFCEPSYRDSEAYKEFWIKLGRGAYDSGQYPWSVKPPPN